MAYQNQESPNILLTKSTKKGNFGSKCESRDISPIKVVKEVFKHDKSIATKRKREFDELDGAVTKLKCKKSSFMSLLKLVRIQFSLGGNRIK
ncbi:uncharacterized protein LOC112599491 [Melanaphis sacchari]|nr:uncharacterized protein LOC112599491 [Melanaphis sacchari]